MTFTDKDLSKLEKEDKDRPRLFIFFLMESVKWGPLILALFLLYRFSEALWHPIYRFFYWVGTGNDLAQ